MSEVCRMVRCSALPAFTAWLPAMSAASARPGRHGARAGPSPNPIPIEPVCFRKSRRLDMALSYSSMEGTMSHLFTHPLPWYIAGPLIGLVVPALLLLGNKPFGVASNFRHLCAALAPCGIEFFSHDWKRLGLWNLTFLLGIFAGAAAAAHVAPPLVVTVSPHTVTALHQLGLHDLTGLAPREVFAW